MMEESDAFLMTSVKRLNDIFKDFDLDRNKKLDEAELCQALRKLHLPCTTKDIDILLGGTDGKGLTEMQFASFCFKMEQHLWDVFKTFDADDSGVISRSEFAHSVHLLGWKLGPEKIDIIFRDLDSETDGELTYREWRNILLHAPPEGKAWVEIFYNGQMVSESILGDNLRKVRQRGESKVIDVLAGLIAGTVSRTVTAPAERVKTDMQLATSHRSVMATIRTVLAEGGPKSFFQGNLVNCVKVAPQSALFFVATDYFKANLPTRGDPSIEGLHSFLSGTLAGLVSQAVIYPFEPIKTIMTVAPPGKYAGILDCGQQILRDGGVRALYQGCVPTMLGCIPYAGTQRMVYDFLQNKYRQYSTSDRPTALVGFSCGVVSSSLGMYVSYPLVLVRTKLQVKGGGIFDCVGDTLKQDGLKGFFRGVVPNLVKGAPAAAINFALYDYAKDSLKHFC